MLLRVGVDWTVVLLRWFRLRRVRARRLGYVDLRRR